MIPYIGDFVVNSTVRYFFGTNASAGASVNRTTAGSIRVYKNTSVTERTSVAGITDTSGFDSVTGLSALSIDLSNNTDVGFYAAANDYVVVLVGAVIDTQTVNVPLFQFSIENRTSVTRSLSAGAITSSAIANSAINLRLANDPLTSNARFTTYDSFSGYPVLSQSAQHQISITGAHHAAADVHEFQPNVITNTATDATFVNELVDAVWDEIASGHLIAGSFGAIMDTLRKSNYVVNGIVTSSVIPTPTEFSTNIVALDGTYDHQTVLFLTGDLTGESKPSLTSSQANGLFTMEEAFTGIPQAGDEFVILPTHVHAVSAIADGLLNRLLDSSGNSEDVFNERTVRSALRAMRNKVMVNTGTMAVYKEDDTTAAWEGTISNTADVTVNPDGGSS